MIQHSSLVEVVPVGRFYESELDDNTPIDEFTLIDEKTGERILLTREEKERIFLDSIQSYYFSGKSKLPDDQFDALKEDLSWEGSALVNLNRNETLFMNAMQAYLKGKPIISDKQWDELKISLRESKSLLAVSSEPKCYVDTGVCKVTWKKNEVLTSSLYVPATLIALVVYLGAIYEIDSFKVLDINPLFALLIGSLPIQKVVSLITENVFFSEPLVASGPCPSCNADNKIFFGNVLGVEGDKEEATLKCSNCKTSMTIKRNTLRVSTLLNDKKKLVTAAAGADDE